MKTIFEYIQENKGEVAYVTRTARGNWTLSLKKQGNITGRTITSYSQISDTDLNVVRCMEITVYDFLPEMKSEAFMEMFREMERVSSQLCY